VYAFVKIWTQFLGPSLRAGIGAGMEGGNGQAKSKRAEKKEKQKQRVQYIR
jgi:hypothetical protein